MFVTFWGLIILVPIYGSAHNSHKWDHFAISNVLAADRAYRVRLWCPAFLCYFYAGYFCSLLKNEYQNFAVRRLQYLVQVSYLHCLFCFIDSLQLM